MHQEKQSDVILFLFLPASFFTDDITTFMNLFWIDSFFRFTLEIKPSASSKVCLIHTCPGLALDIMFLHSFHL